MTTGAARWWSPAATTMAQKAMETMKPARPTSISGLRPKRSDRRAQKGEEKAQSRAEREKTAATIGSGMPMDRPMAGRTEIMPVLPMAVTMETAKMMANVDRGRPLGTLGPVGESLDMGP